MNGSTPWKDIRTFDGSPEIDYGRGRELPPPIVDEAKRYSPAEARVPAGEPGGGQWTAGTVTDSMNSNAEGYVAAGGRLILGKPESKEKLQELFTTTVNQLSPFGDTAMDTGKEYTRGAIDDIGDEYHEVRVAQAKTGHIAGAIEWTKPNPGDDIYINLLGSTGVAPGTGSALVRLVFREAAKRGVGIIGSPDTPAAPFWRKMGFTVDMNPLTDNSMSISADDVRKALPK